MSMLSTIAGLIGVAPVVPPTILGTPAGIWRLANSAASFNYTLVSGATGLLVFCFDDVSQTFGTPATWTATGQPSQTLTPLTARTNGATQIRAYYLTNPTPSAGVIAIQMSTITSPNGIIPLSITGWNGAVPAETGQAGALVDPPPFNLTGVAPNSLIIHGVCGSGSGNSITFAAAETLILNQNAGNAGTLRWAVSRLTSVAGGTVSLESNIIATNPRYAESAIALAPAGAATYAFADEFSSLSLDTALNGSANWAWHWVAWNVYALDSNSDKAWKAWANGGHFDGAPTPAQMGVTLHEVSNGTLKLYGVQNPQPTQFPSPNYPYPYIGGMISSELSQYHTYGTWECRAKFNVTKGQHWAMWLLPKAGGWPPEIDIVEIVSNGTASTLNRLFLNAHGYSGANNTNGLDTDGAGTYWLQLANATEWQDWHTYRFVWTAEVMEWWVDGIKRRWITNYVNEPMYFLITPEIANNWAGLPDGTTTWPMVGEIDYVHYSA